ncbi:RNA polymerase sigma factor, sigma-70 family [Oceanobacillus limi]|uniref:RNA polymerase sigma factor, sigma-70 family n=1 Tax=Oceanobacillus limi TaxID=930131 RepID=A0A1H9Y0D5_9BACI|nr:sigma-70 family RNA polymerase sigma factor [Oceanobacillus limi]SES62070.1 RNA polymerase sigma factor, sigma-70 family [Oceanobacillus limi]
MSDDEKRTFEEIFKQNENKIHYYIHKLQINDTHKEFYVEGLYAMWMAYKKYQPDKGPLSTYFNYMIKNRMIDLIRSKARDEEKTDAYLKQEQIHQDDGNRFGGSELPIVPPTDITISDQTIWEQVQATLTDNQWKWVYYAIIQEMPQKEIAEAEQVSINTVKSWGREARKKLRASGIYSEP